MRDVILTALLIAAVGVVWVRRTRAGDRRKARRSSYHARIAQARQESPAELVLATAQLLAADLRRLPDRLAWPAANQISADLARAADEVDQHTKGVRR